MKETIKKYANKRSYSDITPFEVVRAISDKTIEVREMEYTRDESVTLEWFPGGFAGHCKPIQKWILTSNKTKPVIRLRLNAKGWQDKHGSHYTLSDCPADYNF